MWNRKYNGMENGIEKRTCRAHGLSDTDLSDSDEVEIIGNESNVCDFTFEFSYSMF